MSCSVTYVKNPYKMIVSSDSTGLQKDAAIFGHAVRYLYKGDALTVLGDQGAFYIILAPQRDTGFVNKVDVSTPDQYAANLAKQNLLNAMMTTPLTFTMPKNQAEDAWGRAQNFVNTYASVKIQLATKYLLNTYNPTPKAPWGYAISRVALDDRTMSFTVNCLYGRMHEKNPPNDEISQNAHAAAYYILTGQLSPDLVYTN